MVAKLYRGGQLHQKFKRSEWIQGVQVPLGVVAVLPFTLADQPQSREATRCFLGTVGGARGRLVVLGLDFDVDITARTVTWLATARWPLLATNIVTVTYYTRGITA